MASALANKVSVSAPSRVAFTRAPCRAVRPARSSVKVNALATQLVISGATAALLGVGRFAFLPFQRRKVEQASDYAGPKGNQEKPSYFDSLQQEASFVTTTNDPAGFTIVDTLAWGALGHAVGFAALAANSLQG